MSPKEKVNMLKSLQRENLRMAKELKERKVNQMKKRKVKMTVMPVMMKRVKQEVICQIQGR